MGQAAKSLWLVHSVDRELSQVGTTQRSCVEDRLAEAGSDPFGMPSRRGDVVSLFRCMGHD
jgi:hypothetical protein